MTDSEWPIMCEPGNITKFRILLCSSELSPLYPSGGVGTYVIEAAKTLVQSGRFEVDILCEKSRYAQADWNETVRHLGNQGIKLHGYSGHPAVDDTEQQDHPWVYRSRIIRDVLLALHRQHRYTLIEFAEWGGEGAATVQTKNSFVTPAPLIAVRLHSPSLEIAVANGEKIDHYLTCASELENDSIRHADVVLSPSSFLLDWARSNGLINNDSAMRSPYPYSSLGSPDNLRADLPAPRALKGHRPLIAYFGRLELRKGLVELSEAIKQMKDNLFPEIDFELAFIGADTNRAPAPYSSMQTYLESELDRFGICSYLPAMQRDDLMNWLDTHADIVVVPSQWDNYPNVILEAAQLRCGLVVSDAGGIRELLDDYQITAATVFPRRDTHALALALGKLITASQATFRPNEISISCTQVQQEFIKLYQSMCSAEKSVSQRADA